MRLTFSVVSCSAERLRLRLVMRPSSEGDVISRLERPRLPVERVLLARLCVDESLDRLRLGVEELDVTCLPDRRLRGSVISTPSGGGGVFPSMFKSTKGALVEVVSLIPGIFCHFDQWFLSVYLFKPVVGLIVVKYF